MSDQDYENTIAHLDERIAELGAARLAYASEFDGDVGSIHENIRKLKAENAKLKEDYNDLIYQVATKFPSESRHETAKRYIKQAEDRPSQCSAALQEDKQDGN